MKFKTTAEIPVPERIIDQIIGQDKAVDILKTAAKQKRNVLLIGPPGTGKSMMAQAMAELMQGEDLEDVLVYANPNNENQPLVRVLKTYPNHAYLSKNRDLAKYYTQIELEKIKKLEGKPRAELAKALRVGIGRRIASYQKPRAEEQKGPPSLLVIVMVALLILAISISPEIPDNLKLLATVGVLGIGFLFVLSSATAGLGRRLMTADHTNLKLIVDNSERLTAPFIDATGSRAGSLLGDVKHDPLQTFFPTSTAYVCENGKTSAVQLKPLVDGLLAKYPDKIERDEKYEGLVLPESEHIYVLGHKDGTVKPVRVLCVNRRMHNGKMRAVTHDGRRLVLTPEHKVYVDGAYIEAETLDGTEKLTAHAEPIITKDVIIRTFSEADQKDAYNYYQFLKIKNENPRFGYKKIARMLGIKTGQVRWWNNATNKPKPVKTIERLEKLNLLPFHAHNPAAPAVARVLGTTFGDGGVFSTLNGIFLSSAEEDSLNQYAQDLISVFGEGIGKNFERRISGINNTGMVAWNTNRDVVRFFIALGAPVGRKNKQIKMPSWIRLNSETEREFFGAFLGNELCSPRYCPKQNKIQAFGLGLAGDISLKENRLMLLRELGDYLNSYGVRTSPNINENEFRKGRFVWRLIIASDIENLSRFYELIPIRYSEAKLVRIRNAINDVLERKRAQYGKFMELGKTRKYTHSTLRVSEGMLQKIMHEERMEFNASSIDFTGHIYNVTTESGNLFANGILVANSGGLGTPSHLRVEAGAIHQASKGVLFIDEIASLKLNWQQDILTAMQEKRYPITGQSEMGSGALVKTQPVPTDFVLVAAGNLQDMPHIHPALRSRIRGGGYEVYVEDTMEDTPENTDKVARFIAQEVKRDGKIPHFDYDAAQEIIEEAKRMSGRRKRFTLNLREIGGLVRAAGDVARENGHAVVAKADVAAAKKVFKSLEGQLGAKMIEMKKEYQTIATSGAEIGRVNGLAVLGDSRVGLVLPIVAEATPSASKSEGRVIATGKLGTIAKEAVDNVSAIFKKYVGTDISRMDLHIQFLQTYEGVEGDSASISTAVAVISALSEIPVRQEFSMTGSLDVRGHVLPVGGITGKIEAAIDAGLSKVLIPKANAQDVYLPKELVGKIEIIQVSDLGEVLGHVLQDCREKKELLKKIRQN